MIQQKVAGQVIKVLSLVVVKELMREGEQALVVRVKIREGIR